METAVPVQGSGRIETPPRDHVRVVGAIHVVQAIVYAAMLAAFLSSYVPDLAAGREQMPELAWLAVGIVSIVLAPLAIGSAVCGWALLRRRAWSRVPAICLSLVQLINVPLGTAAGAYGLWVLLNEGRSSALREGR